MVGAADRSPRRVCPITGVCLTLALKVRLKLKVEFACGAVLAQP